jgi:hypothetical protein
MPPPTTLSKTVSAIVERSLLVTAPFEGTLVLEPGEESKFRLAEKLFDLSTVGRGVKPRGLDGKRLIVCVCRRPISRRTSMKAWSWTRPRQLQRWRRS